MPARGHRGPRTPCTWPGCDRDAVAGGLCLRDYKRARRGVDPHTPTPAVGDPDRHGRYGLLDVDDDGVLCHECGARRQSVGSHLTRAHGMTADEYRAAHGLPRGQALTSPAVRDGQSARASARVGTPAWRRLEDARDPAAAAAARDHASFARRGEHVAEHATRAVTNGLAAAGEDVRACEVCQATWCTLPGGHRTRTCSPGCYAALLARTVTGRERLTPERDAQIYADVTRRGRTYGDVAAGHGLTPERVGQIVRRLRAAAGAQVSGDDEEPPTP